MVNSDHTDVETIIEDEHLEDDVLGKLPKRILTDRMIDALED